MLKFYLVILSLVCFIGSAAVGVSQRNLGDSARHLTGGTAPKPCYVSSVTPDLCYPPGSPPLKKCADYACHAVQVNGSTVARCLSTSAKEEQAQPPGIWVSALASAPPGVAGSTDDKTETRHCLGTSNCLRGADPSKTDCVPDANNVFVCQLVGDPFWALSNDHTHHFIGSIDCTGTTP